MPPTSNIVRFMLQHKDGRILLHWDCGWKQAWRLVHLFEKMPSNGTEMFLYFGEYDCGHPCCIVRHRLSHRHYMASSDCQQCRKVHHAPGS